MKKILVIFICLLIALSVISCDNTNIPADTETGITAHSTDQSLSNAVIEKVDGYETEKSQTDNIENVINISNDADEAEQNIVGCSLSVRCDTALEKIDELSKEKAEILPQDGIIFSKTGIVFYEGESVFNVLTRELKKKRIHIDFVNVPMYNTVYIKGISNLYERDCGDLSGWIYKVNGKVPGYGCSQYILNNGDEIEFIYTCDLGKDID